MKNKIAFVLIAAVIAASGCTSEQPDSKTVHDDVVQFLEDDKDNKEIIGVIAGETQHDIYDIQRGQWKDYHDYTIKYYCFEQRETQYCELKEEYRGDGGF